MVERGAQGTLHPAGHGAWTDLLLQGVMNHTQSACFSTMTMLRPQSQPGLAAQWEQDEQGGRTAGLAWPGSPGWWGRSSLPELTQRVGGRLFAYPWERGDLCSGNGGAGQSQATE